MAETLNAEEVLEKEKPDLKNSPLSDAIYKELSRINGRINQMSKAAVISKLKQLKLNTEGTCDVLKKRLKIHYKKQKLSNAHMLAAANLLPFYVIVDFEATCQEVNGPDYPHEIIEFPAVLINTELQKIVDHFQAYCRPVVNPILSPFCRELTGIEQEQVDAADLFPKVLGDFEAWLKKNKLGSKYKYAIVTDGPWDMGRFLYGQCKISEIPYPQFAKKWINIRKTFSNFYKSKRFCLKLMLEHLELEFEGRPHCGLDDATNIARVLMRLMNDGASIQVNERIHLNRRDQSDRTVVPIVYNEQNVTFATVNRERSLRNYNKEIFKDSDDEETGGAG